MGHYQSHVLNQKICLLVFAIDITQENQFFQSIVRICNAFMVCVSFQMFWWLVSLYQGLRPGYVASGCCESCQQHVLLQQWGTDPWFPLARYVKLRVAHAPGIQGTFSPPPRVSDPDMQHGTCVTHVLWCMPGSLTSSFLWSRWWGKRSRHSRRMHNQQFYGQNCSLACCNI